MKIVAGLGSVEEYESYVKAGADELFAGYVPARWSEKYGTLLPINRREVRFANVQLGSKEDLLILRKKIEAYGVPVILTFNSPFYAECQYDEIVDVIRECVEIGYRDFIVADPALLLRLRSEGVSRSIHLSGEIGEINTSLLREAEPANIKRVIFHRKNSISDMQSIIENCSGFIPEYEAFFLNEKCHFTGGFCNSLHCDEMCHICHIPNRLGVMENAGKLPEEIPVSQPEEYLVGETGCGLCALWKLREAGITHLKIVGRGNYPEDMARDIAAAKAARSLLDANIHEESYIAEVRRTFFPDGCSENCYYI